MYSDKTGLRLGLTMRIDRAENSAEFRDALSQEWPVFIAKTLPHAQWLPVPNIGQEVIPFIKAWGLNGFILTGGNDLNQSPIRDVTEFALLSFAQDNNLPVLGICRGMQVMGTWAGCTLKPVEGHVRTRHCLHGRIAGKVNSFHTFALADTPSHFSVTARSGDNVIEAICHNNLPWEGWMWHPEREREIASDDILRIRKIFLSREMSRES